MVVFVCSCAVSRADSCVLSFMSSVLYCDIIRCIKKGGSSSEDTIIQKSGLGGCMLFTSITHMYKLYVFPRKISGAITDSSVYVYHLLDRERAFFGTVQTADGM